MNDSSPPVLHYIDAVRLEAGGVVRCVLDLCGVLAARGNAITLATLDASDVPQAWQDRQPNTPTIVELDSSETDRVPKLIREFAVVHLHTPWHTGNLAFSQACRRERIPYVISVHGMLDNWCMAQKRIKKRVYWWLCARRLLEQAHAVHTTAEGESRQAEQWYPRGKSVTLPLVVDMPAPEELPDSALAREQFECLRTDEPTLLFLSRLHPKKGVETLLQSVARLHDSATHVQTIVAGPGDDDYVGTLKDQARRLGVADWVHFVGMVKGDLKWSLYQACDLFVLPTQQENFGLVLPEALACGTPVVTTTGVDTWPELKQAGGEIVKPRAPKELATSIGRLLAGRDNLPALGARGREYVANWLDPDRVAAEFEQLYRECAPGHSSR